VAAWCSLKGLSPWLGLVYAFFVGNVVAFTRDLNEPLAFALVAVAVYAYERWPRQRLWAGLVFGLSALGRESTLIFGALYVLRYLWEEMRRRGRPGRLGRVGAFTALVFAPALLWQGFLIAWLGRSGLGQGTGLINFPFSSLWNIYRQTGLKDLTLEVVEVVVVPGLVCMGAGLYFLWRSREARLRPEVWALIANALLFVVLLPLGSMIDIYAAGRITIPIVLAAIYSLAHVSSRGWFWFCSGLWLASSVAYVLNPLFELFNRG
jgi:hypothetical protein